jgi:tetratricopeptide (TPR) repeat protein
MLNRMSFKAILAGVLVALAPGPVARAQSNEDVTRARAHYEAGSALYSLGKYDDALREFVSGYQLTHRAEFLVNLGQTYRKLNDAKRALEMYRQYLREAPATDPARTQVADLVAALERDQPSTAPTAPPAVATPPSQVVATPPPTPISHRRRFVAAPIGTALALGALVTASALEGSIAADYGSLQHSCSPMCSTSTVSSLGVRINAANALFIAGGVLALGTAVAWIVEARRHR